MLKSHVYILTLLICLDFHEESTLATSGYASLNAPATEMVQLLEPLLNMVFQRKVLAAGLNASFLEASLKPRTVLR